MNRFERSEQTEQAQDFLNAIQCDSPFQEPPKRVLVNDREMTTVDLYFALARYEPDFRADNPDVHSWTSCDPSYLEECRKRLERYETTMNQTLNKPAMIQQSLLMNALHKMADEHRFERIVQAHNMLKKRLLGESVEVRRRYWTWLDESGDIQLFKKIDELDESVMTQFPDPAERAKEIAGAKALHRSLSNGDQPYIAARAWSSAMLREKFRRKGAAALESVQEDVLKALEAAHGNKTAAARLLGISRARMRRLTGEQM
jgi:hypothetical protein